ncbi:MAG: hypothetical protein R6W72_12350 [Desulfurivibrionaceae bacterium]
MNRFRNSVLTLTILFVSLSYGCTSYKIPPVGGNILSNKVSLNLDESAIFFSGVSFDLQNQHKKAFISALSYMTQLNRNTEGDRINISAIKIDSRTRSGVGGPVVMAILSTPIILPFSLLGNGCAVDINLSYVIAKEDGSEEQRTVSHTIRGSYSGWSFTRFSFREKVKKNLQAKVPKLAAEMLVANLQEDRL